MAYIVSMTKAKKDIKISFRVSYADAMRIDEAATDAKRSLSDFVRLAVLDRIFLLDYIKEKTNA